MNYYFTNNLELILKNSEGTSRKSDSDFYSKIVK